jgi:hypothetical protein
MAVTDDDGRLGCGRTVAEVWEGMHGPPDAHEASCPDCTDARRSLEPLVTASHDLRVDDEQDEELRVPIDVLDRVLDVARAEVRRGRTLPLRLPPPEQLPALTVSEQTVAALVRRTADLDPAVEARRCTVVALDGGAPGDPAAFRVELRLSVAASASIPEATERLRSAIIAAVSESVGVTVPLVDLIVEDVHDA